MYYILYVNNIKKIFHKINSNIYIISQNQNYSIKSVSIHVTS